MPLAKHFVVHVACFLLFLPVVPWVCTVLPMANHTAPQCINTITMGWQVFGGVCVAMMISWLLQRAFTTRFAQLDVLVRAQQPRAQHQQVLDKWAADIKALESVDGGLLGAFQHFSQHHAIRRHGDVCVKGVWGVGGHNDAAGCSGR